MLPANLISSDGHVYEPPDLWTSRIAVAFKERAPRIVEREDGDWWFCEGNSLVGTGVGAQTGRRFTKPKKLTLEDKFANVRRGAFDPLARVKDMETDGIWAEVIYPTAGRAVYSGVLDSLLLTAICSAYNTWLADFCSVQPKRYKGIAMINIDDVGEALKQLKLAHKTGLAGVMIPVFPADGKPYDSPDYEPFWALTEDLGIPVSLHTGTSRRSPGQPYADSTKAKPSMIATRDYRIRVSLADLIFSGVFERHPKLMVGSIEHELGWIPSFLERMDYTYTQGIYRKHWQRFKGAALPSDFFHRNIFCKLPARRHRYPRAQSHRRQRPCLGLRLPASGGHFPKEPRYPREDSPGRAGCRGDKDLE